MKTLRSHLCGSWYAADGDFQTLVNPSTEEPLARASSRGADFAAAYRFALERGGPALCELTFAQRGELLKAMSRLLREHRDELLTLSRDNNGTTAMDGSFDVDGGGGSLAFYAALGRTLGDVRFLAEDEALALGKGDGFWGRHLLVPRRGVAVAINAFNFPLWGFAEKAAQALLAGMPMIVKPATATALVTERAVEILVEAKVLPEGALQLVVGSPGRPSRPARRPGRARLHRLGGDRADAQAERAAARLGHAGQRRGRQPERRGARPRRRARAHRPSTRRCATSRTRSPRRRDRSARRSAACWCRASISPRCARRSRRGSPASSSATRPRRA